MSPLASWRLPPFLLPLLALVAFGSLFQGARPIFDPDEGRYTAVALEMIRTGDWVSPQLNDNTPHLTKPPLTYWLIAASIEAFGRTPAAARLPNTLALIGTVLLVAGIGRHLVPEAPRLAAVIQATSIFPIVAANTITTDTLLALWEVLAVYGFVLYRFAPRRSRWALVLMWAGFGLAFFTKGPPGLLPLLAIVVFVGVTDGLAAIPRLASLLGLASFVVIGFGWFAVILLQQPELWSYFLLDEVVARVVTDKHYRNAGWWGLIRAFVPPLVVGSLPWSVLALRRRWARRGAEQADEPNRAGRRFLLLWVLLPLAIFILARSRLPLYLLPLWAPISLLLARSLVTGRKTPIVSRGWLAAWVLVLLALRLAGGWVPTRRDSRPLAEAIRQATRGAPAEVLFVDKNPLYSLAFHLGAQVERVNLFAPLPEEPEAAYQLFLTEAALNDAGALYLVAEPSIEEMRRQAATLGLSPRRIGDEPPYVFFLLTPEPASATPAAPPT